MPFNQMSIKVASMLADMIAPLVLARTGFTTAEALTDTISANIKLVYVIIPVILCVACTVCLMLYNLTESKLEELRTAHSKD